MTTLPHQLSHHERLAVSQGAQCLVVAQQLLAAKYDELLASAGRIVLETEDESRRTRETNGLYEEARKIVYAQAFLNRLLESGGNPAE